MLLLLLGVGVSSPCSAQVVERGALPLPEAVVEMRAAALLMSGQQGGDLPTVVLPVEIQPSGAERPDGERGKDDRQPITVVVEVDGASLLEAAAEDPERPFELYVYAVGPSLDVRGAASLRLDRPTAFESSLVGAGLRALATLHLDPGPQELRVLARLGERFGLRRLPVDVAETPSARLGRPVLATDDADWLVAVPRREPPALPAGFALDGALPAALPVLVAGEDATVGLDGSGIPDAEGSPFQAVLDAEGDDRQVILDLSPTRTGARLATDQLAEGAWTLRLRTRAETSPPVSVLVAQQVAPWPELMRRGTQSEVATGGDAEVVLPEDVIKRLEVVLASYLEGLAKLAAGDRDGAAAHVAALEAETESKVGPRALPLLLELQVEAFERLMSAAGGPGPLLGVLLVHGDAARLHRDGGRFRLSNHSLAVGAALASRYGGETASRSSAHVEAARVLTAYAGVLRTQGSLRQAVTLYRQAIELDAQQVPALFGLAVVLAKFGGAEEACDLLARVVEIDAEHHEARLRWAVLLQRLGELEAAGREYAFLERAGTDAAPVPDWVASVAAQQRIRLVLDSGDLAAARTILQRALERWPDHAPLHVARARLAERGGDLAAARRWLSRLDLAESRDAVPLRPGGRMRLNDWPTDDLEPIRAQLAEAEVGRRADLGRAVAEVAEQTGEGRRRGGSRRDRR